MKKLLPLLVLLLPFFAISQTTLVRWDGANLQANPYLISSNISAGNITGSNVSFFTENWGNNGNAFNTAEWPTSTSPSYSKYVQVSISANSGYKIDLSQFNFEYQNYDSNGPSKVQVYYSKDPSFPSNGTLLHTGNLNTSNTNFHSVSVSLTGITVLANETVYLRIAAYQRTNGWSGARIRFRHGYNDNAPASHNASGPNITGTVSSVCTPQGNSSVSPTGSWNGYVYSYSGTPAATTYLGYVTENETFNRNVADGAVSGATTFLCQQPTDNFYTSYKMTKTFPAGTYTFTVGGDDGYRLKVNGESGYSIDQWSDHGYTTTSTTKTFSSSTSVSFVLEYYEKGGQSQVSFDYTCGNSPTAPTTLSSNATNNSICSGNSVTLTAGGGLVNTSTYQWGTGTTVGSNIISGSTASITVSPTTTTTYWVRRVGAAPCNFTTAGVTLQVSVVSATATAPTSITGATSICVGGSTTLTATGGTGTTYEWGTGTTIGSNPIAGSGASITVSPTTATTYWVRRINTTPCSTPTAGVTATVTINTPSGDPTAYGINTWNVYGYNVGSMTPALANYVGYYTQNTLSLNTQDTANNGWDKNYSPSSSAGWVGCTVPNDDFTMIHKRKGFPCGKYQIYMDNWDDETRVYINGVQAFYNGGWSGDNPTPTLVGNYSLDSNSTIEIITREVGGSANVKLSLTPVNAIYNGSTWSSSPDGAAVIVNGTLNMTTNTTVCSCTLNSGANVTVASGVTLTVKENLNVHQNANFTVENNASLVQIDDSAVNSGKITVKRNTTPVSRYDFTYWSSPVAASDWTLNNLSPNTLADKYYSYNAAGAGWVIHYGGNIPMETGIGYIVRAPQSYSTTLTSIYQGQFIGSPNNGQKTATIKTGATLKSNLIGNPYPSAISIEKFYEANKTAIKGTFYFWTHNIAVSSTPDANGVYNYNPASYISYNATGATGNGDVNNCTTCGNTTSNKHLGNIASGQGFFVEGKVNNATIVFNNSMRVATAGTNSQFLRSANSESDYATQSTEETAVEKHRLWLNITNSAGAYNETLLGYVSGATNDLDDDYDGITYASGTAIYSLLNDNKLVIQGKALPFSNTDVIPLGFMAAAAGEYSIGLESFDGLFEDQKVYLVDKLTSTIHNIKNDRYAFSTTAAGTFNTRFELRFVNESLGVDTPVVDANDIVVYKNGNQIAIRANNFTIEDVQVFDLTGKEIYDQKEINSSEFSTSGLNVATQVVVVKITLDNNQTISKKVIMN